MKKQVKIIFVVIIVLLAIIALLLYLNLLNKNKYEDYVNDNIVANINEQNPDDLDMSGPVSVDDILWDNVVEFTINDEIFYGDLITSPYQEDQDNVLKISNALYALLGYNPDNISFSEKKMDDLVLMDTSAILYIDDKDIFIGVLGNTAYMKYLD